MRWQWDSFIVLKSLLLVAALSLLCGLFLPILTISKFVLVKNTFSIIGGVIQLLKDGHIFLFVIVGFFSVLLPVLKLIFLARWLFSSGVDTKGQQWLLSVLHRIGRWSMLDVFVVSVLVVAVKLAGVASVQMEVGLYFFSAAVVSTMLLTHSVYDKSRGC